MEKKMTVLTLFFAKIYLTPLKTKHATPLIRQTLWTRQVYVAFLDSEFNLLSFINGVVE